MEEIAKDKKVFVTEVVVSEIQFLKSKGNNEQNYTESPDLFGSASIDISDEALPF